MAGDFIYIIQLKSSSHSIIAFGGHGEPEMANWLDLSDDFCQWPKMESQVVIKFWKGEAAGARGFRGSMVAMSVFQVHKRSNGTSSLLFELGFGDEREENRGVQGHQDLEMEKMRQELRQRYERRDFVH